MTFCSSSVCTLQGIVLHVCGGVYVTETVPLHVGVVARQMELDQGRPTHDGATNADAVHVHLEEAVVALAAVEDLRTRVLWLERVKGR